MKTVTYTLPSYWAPYLINGDDSGYEGDEIQTICQWLKEHSLGSPLTCSDTEEFHHWHEARSVWPVANMCLDYTFQVRGAK